MLSRRTVALVGAVLSCAACSRSSGPIEIGLAGPFSQPRGIAMQWGAQLAVDQINARGGVRGRSLKLRLADDSASENAAVRVAQAFYDNPAVVAVVGHLTSDASIAAALIYGSGSRPVTMISPSASSPDLSGTNSYAFRICPSDSSHGTALARFAWQTLAARRAGIVFISDAYGRGVRKAFAADFARLGGSVVESDPYVPTTRSLEPYLSRMRQVGIDVLLLAADRRGAELALQELRALGLRWPVLAGDALTGIETAGTLGEGVRISAAYLADRAGEKNATFVAEYARAHAGQRPDHRAAGAYDIVNLLAQAISAAGPSRGAVRDYVASVGRETPAFEGVTGRIAFDSAGDVPSKGVVIAVVRGGRMVAELGE